MKTLIACLVIQSFVAGAAFAQPLPLSAPAMPATTAESPRASALETKVAFCDIDALLTPVDDIPPPLSESSLCQPAYSLETLPKFIDLAGSNLNGLALGGALIEYYSFRALAFSSPDQCSALSPLQAAVEKTDKQSLNFDSTWENDCRERMQEMSFVRALVTHDPETAAHCQEWSASDPDNNRRDPDVPALCRKIAAASDLKAVAATVCSGQPNKVKGCADFFRSIEGDASACRADLLSHRSACMGYVAFAKAGPAKKPELCGGNSVCLAMSGLAAGVSVHAQRRIAEDMSPVLFKEAQAKLRALAASSDPLDAALAKEIDAREERIAQLRLKLDPQSRLPAKVLKSAVKRPARGRGRASDGSQE